jgi:hypothetical protein
VTRAAAGATSPTRCGIDSDHADLDQAGLPAQGQDLAEQTGQRVLVALAKARDRRVVGHLLGGDHAEGDITLARSRATSVSRARRRKATAPPSSPDKRRPAVPVLAISGVERGEIHASTPLRSREAQAVTTQTTCAAPT